MYTEERVLPYTDGRYIVNISGEIYDGKVLVCKRVNLGVSEVFLDWFHGSKYYSVALVLIICFYAIKLPNHLLRCVIPRYRNHNRDDLTLSNLYYSIDDDAVIMLHGRCFKYIPYYTDYAVTIDGDIIRGGRGYIKKWYTTKGRVEKNIRGGYKVTRALSDYGPRHISRHRALALAYLPYNDSPNVLPINHKDGIPGNDTLNNLEWSTYALNNKHAYENGLRPHSTVKVLLKYLADDTVRSFNTITDCSRYLNKSDGFVTARISKCSDVVYDDGIMLKFDDGSDWPALPTLARAAMVYSSIVARNVFTGEMRTYKSPSDAELHTGVSNSAIIRQARNNDISPICGFNFRVAGINVKWPNHTVRHLAIYSDYPRKPPNGIVVRDLKENTERFFTSVEKAAAFFGCSISRISARARTGIINNSRLFSYYKLHENLGPAIE